MRRPHVLITRYSNSPRGQRRRPMSKKLEGKVALITGGNSGIGLATARRFVAEGAHVYITGRRQAQLDEAVRHIGKHVTCVQGDVANLADLDRLFAAAGVGELAPLGSISEEHFDKAFGINVKGLLFRRPSHSYRLAVP